MERLARWAQQVGLTRAICLVLLIALVSVRVWDPPPLQELRLRTFDFFQQVRPREATFKPVVILDIDEKSLRELGQWPWPRTLVADLVNRLAELGAVVIGFDVVFPEPDRTSPRVAVTTFRDLDEETRAKLSRLPSHDDVLAQAFRGARVVAGRAGAATASGETDSPAVKQAGFAVRGPDAAPFLVTFPALMRNVPVLEEAAAGRGMFTIRPERDGIVRRVPLVMVAEGRMVPALSLEMLRVATRSDTILLRTDPSGAGVQMVEVPSLPIATDNNAQIWIHFSRHDPGRYISAVDLLHGRVPADRIRQKLVLIGTSATGLLDIKTTPIDPVMPGVEIHAQILESVLTKSVLAYPYYAIGAELTAAVLVGVGVIAATPILGAAPVFILGGAVAAGLVMTSWYWFLQYDLMIDTTFPLISTVLIYLTLVFVNYFREQKQRQQIRAAFGFYLSPVLVEELAKSPEKLVLGGEQRRMTILFSDVRGFTTISEHFKSNPQQLTSLMNRYLTPMTNAVIAHKGTIDKYIGDAIMAFWNAPLDDDRQEINACEAAIEMLARLEKLNEEFEREAKETGQRYRPFRIGIGINTGQCVVGNMGSDFRFDYSVLGDTVNLASRLEGRSKDYGLPIILGAATATAAADKFAMLEIDLIQVKGKSEPEAVFTVLGREELSGSEEFRQLRDVNSKLLAAFRRQDWTDALASIDLCRKFADRFGLHDLYDIYVERIGDFRKNPPPPDWNGVFAYETK
jgi:adenylate cyclase